MNLLLVRHGEIPSNVNKVYAGRSSEGLTSKGLLQAKTVSEKFTDYSVAALYSSPIHRAIQTAEIISAATGVDLSIRDEFREMEFGLWEGLAEDTIARDFPDEWKTWQERPDELRLHGRETLEELQGRVLAGVRDIQMTAGKHNTAIVVTHVAVIRVLLLWHEEKSLSLYKTIQVPNAEIFEIEIN